LRNAIKVICCGNGDIKCLRCGVGVVVGTFCMPRGLFFMPAQQQNEQDASRGSKKCAFWGRKNDNADTLESAFKKLNRYSYNSIHIVGRDIVS